MTTLAMDGVRRTQLRPGVAPTPVTMLKAASRPKPRPISRATSKATQGVRYVTGMDGIRRAVPLTPREMLANIQAPAEEVVVEAAISELEVPAAVAALPQRPALKLPAFTFPEINWHRSAIAFGLVATALVASGVTVRALATPHATTANAAAETATSATPAPATPSATPAAAVVPDSTGLQKILNDFAAKDPGKFGIVVKDLKTGETASVDPEKQLMSASLYKLFVAQRIYQRIDLGQLDYGKPAGGGTGRNIDQCLTIMINISDNACGRALGAILGWGSQDQALKMEGYNQTSLVTPQQTSAADVATLFTRLYNGTLLSANSTNRFMGLLKDQRVNNRLPVGLPAGTVIAHKTGDLDGVVHDAGIVYGPKSDYLVVVTSGPWQYPGNAPAKFADLSRQLWNHFEQ